MVNIWGYTTSLLLASSGLGTQPLFFCLRGHVTQDAPIPGSPLSFFLSVDPIPLEGLFGHCWSPVVETGAVVPAFFFFFFFFGAHLLDHVGLMPMT